MTITTKYDIGQGLYRIGKQYNLCPTCRCLHKTDQWVVDGCIVADYAILEINVGGTQGVWYGSDGLQIQTKEADCFPSEAEAQAEADRRTASNVSTLRL